MHRVAAIPGGWNPGETPSVLIQQTPAPVVILTAADTDIQVLAQAVNRLPVDFPAVRVVNLLDLQHPFTIDSYSEEILESAQVIVLRLLGGRAYWSYGLEVVKAAIARTGAALFVLPGDDRPDPDLLSHSTVPLGRVHQLWRYFTEGGVENLVNGLKFLAACRWQRQDPYLPPQEIPRLGRYPWSAAVPEPSWQGRVGLLFYRAHYLAGNTAAIVALCAALAQRQLEPLPVYVQSLQDPEIQAALLCLFRPPWSAWNRAFAQYHEFFPGPLIQPQPPVRSVAATGCAGVAGDLQRRQPGAVAGEF